MSDNGSVINGKQRSRSWILKNTSLVKATRAAKRGKKMGSYKPSSGGNDAPF